MSFTRTSKDDGSRSQGSPSSQYPRWRLGVLDASGQFVQWTDYFEEEEARLEVFRHRRRRRRTQASMVLFDREADGGSGTGAPVLFSTASSGRNDVAAILHAHNQASSGGNDDSSNGQRATSVDQDAVAALVESGHMPAVPRTHRPPLQQWLLKRVMELTFRRSSVKFFSCGPHRGTSLTCFNVKRWPGVCGHVALSLDDAPCRFGQENSRLGEVREILDRYGACATFMVVGSFMEGHEDELAGLIRDGRNELGNHGYHDRPYHRDTVESFGAAVDACTERIRSVQRRAGVDVPVRWFRAPHGKYTRSMENILRCRGLTNVMCDTYASCPVVEDGEYIGRMLARKAKEGSIIILHMPEIGFRDWCMVALSRLLEDLDRRSLKVVTVSALDELAKKSL